MSCVGSGGGVGGMGWIAVAVKAVLTSPTHARMLTLPGRLGRVRVVWARPSVPVMYVILLSELPLLSGTKPTIAPNTGAPF